MTNKKYELTDDARQLDRVKTVYRIRALRDFGEIKKGQLGGYIETESNLSHAGTAWVHDNAMVCDSARVIENAQVKDRAFVGQEAILSKRVIVEHDARVFGHAILSDSAVVSGNARVSGRAIIKGRAHISDFASVEGKAFVSKFSIVSGLTKVSGNAELLIEHTVVFLYGNATIRGNALISSPNDIITVGGIGPGANILTAYRSKKKCGIELAEESGGFHGTIGKFMHRVFYKNRNNNLYLEQYKATIAFINYFFEINKNRGKHG